MPEGFDKGIETFAKEMTGCFREKAERKLKERLLPLLLLAEDCADDHQRDRSLGRQMLRNELEKWQK